MSPSTLERIRSAACGALLVVLLAGCGGPAPRPAIEPAGALTRVAVLPFENLTAKGEEGEIVTRIFFSTLGETGAWDLVEPGEVDLALEDLGIRSSGALSHDRLKELGDRLKTSLVLMGSVLESGAVKTPDGDVPSIGVALKLVEAGTGRVIWSRVKFRSGEDHETLFGWGRVNSQQKLTARLAVEMLKSLPRITTSTDAYAGDGRK